MRRSLLASVLCALPLGVALAQDPSVIIKPTNTQGSRTVEATTEKSVVRDYLLAWKTMHSALDQNDPTALTDYFVGTAKDKLADTIEVQAAAGIHTRYVERAHNLQIVFYSPEGLSIQIIDDVEYDEQVLSQDKVLASKPVHRRYLVVMSPSEVRWRVRIFQSEAS